MADRRAGPHPGLQDPSEADRYRRLLLDAVSAGEQFEDATGEPTSWNAESLSWFAWSQQWLALKWPQWAGTTRKTAVETALLVVEHLDSFRTVDLADE